MRRAPGLLILALASGALAAPAEPAASWADWIGDWRGKLKWTSCSADGADAASLSVDAVDGAVTIDLAPAGGALTAISLIDDAGGWLGQQGDVTVHLKRSTKASTFELAIDLDSGCEIRATLARASTGIAACDRLSAWARVESQCTKLARPPLENPARVARQRAQWLGAKGEARGKLGAQCAARASKVESELIDVGCAPNPDPEIGLRGADCQALRVTSARLGRCGNVPLDMRTALEREVVVLVAASQGADKSALPVVESECRQVRDRLLGLGKQYGCPL